MKLKFAFVALTLCLLAGFSGFRGPRATVYFIPTIHQLHKSNPNYSYDSLQQIIRRLKPDLIAVEIRNEDMAQDSGYLKKNYPYEMWMMRYWFPEAQVAGFDWVGQDIEGKLIPANYWQEISAIKKQQKALSADSVASKKCVPCNTFSTQRLPLLKQLSLSDLLKSQDAHLTKQYYSCLETALKGTIHEQVLRFYDVRNEKILANINQIVKANPGKTIVVLTGDDHYVALQDKIKHKKIF